MSTPSAAPGAIAGSVLPLRRAEELIATLPGVISVRIVPGESGAVEEIHVLTTDQVPPKNTVRNIESALMAQLGLRVNHRKVSVATTLDAPRAMDTAPESSAVAGLSAIAGGAPAAGTPSTPMPFGAGGTPSGGSAAAGAPAATPDFVPAELTSGTFGRARSSLGVAVAPDLSAGRRLLIFEDVEVRRSRSRGVLCRVTLSRDGQEYFGEAEGQESERSRIELAARATLLAIGTAMKSTVGGERSLSLEGAKLIEAFDREFVFVSVSARIGREPVCLTGSCEIRESAETSAVLSVLDATNRWVHLDR
ncbi:hypothetical protein [Gemmatimonas sp.]|uniref:hypothetical protein n=1 Tax=Gemmatimonas sp. TaxID=1962908 RepID=UPI0025B990F8|nr:hypothetical protein [Gemmatimonas sp.]MCA2992180.1 hypothetical protein [Gemmatimonas sp.]